MTYLAMSGVLNSTGQRVWCKARRGQDTTKLIWKDSEGHYVDTHGQYLKDLRSWRVNA